MSELVVQTHLSLDGSWRHRAVDDDPTVAFADGGWMRRTSTIHVPQDRGTARAGGRDPGAGKPAAGAGIGGSRPGRTYRLWIFPVLLGGGHRLSAGGTPPAALTLLDTEVSATGVVIHTYERVRRSRRARSAAAWSHPSPISGRRTPGPRPAGLNR